MIKIKKQRPNCLELQINGDLYFFSYETLVAMKHHEGNILKTNQFFSKTTSRHINEWVGQMVEEDPGEVKSVEQETLENHLNNKAA